MKLPLVRSHHALLILGAMITAGLCLAKEPAPSPAGPEPGPEPKGLSCSAQLFVTIDRELAAKHAVQLEAINDALGRFYGRNVRFRVADLEQLEVPDMDGRKVRLKEVAKVDVMLSRAK